MKEEIFKKHSKTFYLASRFFSPREQKQITKIYFILRMVDDIVDESDLELDDKRNYLHRVIENDDISRCEGGDELQSEIRNLLVDFPNCKLIFKIFIDAQVKDLSEVNIQDNAELLRYCYGVASTVGLLICHVFNIKNRVALHHAIDLGVAMQLTNICRDVYEDYLMQKLYLPELSYQDFENDRPEKIYRLRKLYLELADDYYLSAYQGIKYLDFRAALAIYFGGVMYQEIGKKILNDQGYMQRVSIGTFGKIWIILREFPRFFKFYLRKKTFHDHKLHSLIRELPYVHKR